MTDLEVQEIIAEGRAAILAGQAAQRVAAVEAECQAHEDALAEGSQGYLAAHDARREILRLANALNEGRLTWAAFLLGTNWAGSRAGRPTAKEGRFSASR
jgi:hypothetical protein